MTWDRCGSSGIIPILRGFVRIIGGFELGSQEISEFLRRMGGLSGAGQRFDDRIHM
jgi:hypothetical protein